MIAIPPASPSGYLGFGSFKWGFEKTLFLIIVFCPEN